MNLYSLIFGQYILFPVIVLQAPLKLSSTKFVFEIPLHEVNFKKKITRSQV